MSDSSLETELIHLTCPHCQQITSLSLGSLKGEHHLKCPFCGQQIPIDFDSARQDAQREALELDASPDSLGSVE